MQPKFIFIEIARVVCILIVVFTHAMDFAVMRTGETQLTLIISSAIRFIVPAFFMISGFLMGQRHGDVHFHVDFQEFWRRRIPSLILPFFVWNLIYMVIFEVIPGKSIFTGQTLFNVTTGYMHLYFVTVLLQCLLIYSFLANSFSVSLVHRCLLIGGLCSVLFYSISEALLWTVGPDGHAFEWRYGKLIFPWGIFYFWGIWLGYQPKVLEKLRSYRYWLLVVSIVVYVPYYLDTQLQLEKLGSLARDYFLLSGLPYQFVSANAFLVMLYSLEKSFTSSPISQRIAGWGRYMFGVYVAHMAVVFCIVGICSPLLGEVGVAAEVIFITILTFFFSVALVKVCSMPPFKLFGVIIFGGRGN